MKNYVRLHYPGNISKIIMAVNKANEILSSPEFYYLIDSYRSLNNRSTSPGHISRFMQESGRRIQVRTSWFKTMPEPGLRSDKIVVCRWDFSKRLPAGVNTLIHETVNSLGRYNNSNGIEILPDRHYTSASWVIGAIAETMVR